MKPLTTSDCVVILNEQSTAVLSFLVKKVLDEVPVSGVPMYASIPPRIYIF